MRLCVLTGGSSNEREISIASADMIVKHLDKSKYDIEVIHIPADNSTLWVRRLLDNPPDMVLSGLHGGKGENGAVQGLLQCLNIPYVGSKITASAICMNKYLSKIIMSQSHIPCAEGILIRNPGEVTSNEGIIRDMGFPIVVKPNCGGSSIGISIVNKFEQMQATCDLVFHMGDVVLAEKFYEGREVTCGICERDGNLEILGVLDILPQNKFYDYEAKYVDSKTYIGFSELPKFMQTMIEKIAKKAFTVLACSGYGRIDMIVYNEQVAVIEMNTLPGLTSHSLIPKATQGLEGGFSAFLDLLVEQELQNQGK